MRCWAILLIACGIALSATGQQRYSISHYSNEDGLPTNAIKGMEWDAPNGLLWIGTEGGIVRWDGSHFETATITEGRVMGMGRIGSRKHSFFAWCDNDSIYIIERGRMRTARGATDPLPVRHQEVAQPDALSAEIRVPEGTVIWPEWLVPAGDAGSFLLLQGTKLYLREGQRARLLRQDLHDVQLIRASGRVFVNSKEGLWLYDPVRKELPPFLRSDGTEERRLVPTDRDGLPMLYAGGTLFRLLPPTNGGPWGLDPLFTELPADAKPFLVRELSSPGIIVLADRINGIYILRPKSIRQLTDSTGRTTPAQLVTYGQALLPDGRILGHSGVVYDRKGPVAGLTLPVGGSTDLYRYGGHLYFPNNNSLFRYDLRTQTSEQLAGLDSSDWGTMVQTRGQLYVLGARSLSRLAGDRLEPLFRFPAAAGHQPIRNITAIEWTPGHLLIGSLNYIRFFDIDRRQLRTLKVSEKAPVRHLWRRPYGAFICTYGEGIFLYENDSVRALPKDRSGYLRFAHAIVPDGHGFCYISTNNGLFKVSEHALRASAGSGAPVYFHFLGKSDGLEQTELNGGGLPPYLELPDKTLSFPTMNGLAQLHPDSVRISAPTGVILVRASADGREIDSFPARLAAQVNVLRFDVTVPFWGAPENLYAWYRLRRRGATPDEAQWVPFDPARQRQFDFTALKADRYDFEVRTFNGFAPGNFAVRSFHFEVEPSWYATGRFRLLWLALLGAFIWLTTWLRTRQLRARGAQLEATVAGRTREIERQKQELGRQLKLVSEAHDLKERLIAVIGHNIITPLRYIHRATTMMREDARSLDPSLREKAIDSINDTSLELELLSVNLLNWIKLQHQQLPAVPEAFTFADIAEHVRGLLEPVARSKGQQILIDTAQPVSFFQFRDALQVILYNLVLNAITHSGGTVTELMCSEEAEGFTITVRDNGRGISPAQQEKLLGTGAAPGSLKETENQGKGFGFIIIRDLVRYIGGRLLFGNEGPGSTISVHFANRPAAGPKE